MLENHNPESSHVLAHGVGKTNTNSIVEQPFRECANFQEFQNA